MPKIAKLPNGPNELKVKQLFKFIRKPIPFLEECRRKYGKTFTLRMPGQPPYVVVSDPVDVKKIFTTSSEHLHTGEINASIFKPVLGNLSLLTLDGEKHLQHRKLMLPAFHGERMQIYGKVMSNMTRDKITSWKVGSTVSLFEEIRDITFSIILHTVFGVDEDSFKFSKLDKSLQELLFTIKSPFGLITLLSKSLHFNLGPITPWAKILKLRNDVDEGLIDEIQSRRKTDLTNRADVLSILLQVCDEAGLPMSNQEIRDEMLTLLIAGHETTATGITWALYHILSNDRILQTIKAELNNVLGKDGNIITNANKLFYLDAVIKESLRLIPVVPYIVRLTKQNYQLNDFLLPKGVAIVPSIYLAHHETDHWFDSKIFSPERFLNSTEKPYTFLPFGGGARRCIGAAYAQYEMKIVLSEILFHSELILKRGYVPKLIRKGVVITPSEGVPVVVRKVGDR
jgi:cytochrome P450